jgi:hypothetical protein
MELSERERRLLREMESHLLAEDPGLASSLRVHRLRGDVKVALAGFGLVAGAVLMGVGTVHGGAAGVGVALVGFLVLLASVAVTVDYVRVRRGRSPARSESSHSEGSNGPPPVT